MRDTTRPLKIVLASGLALLLMAAACGGAATAPPGFLTPTARAPGTAAVPPTPTTRAPATAVVPPTSEELVEAGGVVVKTAKDSEWGTILVDADGRTLYLFTSDGQDKSTCSGPCAGAWPPLVTTGPPAAEEGVTPGFLGTATREDGSSQVTYNGWPLYRFGGDKGAGDTNGQGSGGAWFLVSPEGEAVKSKATQKGGDRQY
ncbi:MAG: hypothetical protein ACE5JL_13365 [Dehalococcoidia bacterium]